MSRDGAARGASWGDTEIGERFQNPVGIETLHGEASVADVRLRRRTASEHQKLRSRTHSEGRCRALIRLDRQAEECLIEIA